MLTEEERKERARERARRYYIKYPERVKANSLWSYYTRKDRGIKPPKRSNEKRRSEYLKSKYGITEAVYQSMLEKQSGLCAICKCEEASTPKGKLCIDHNHKTGKLRALLCNNCNAALGLLDEYTGNFKRAILYLEYFSEAQ